MRWVGSLVQMALGLSAAMLGFRSDLLLDLVRGVGVEAPASLVLILPLVVGLGGVLAFSKGLWRIWNLVAWSDGQQVWADALREVADEYGTVVVSEPGVGVKITAVTEGSRLEVVVRPDGVERLSVWLGCPGLQTVLVTAVRGTRSSEGDGRWRHVGRRGNWELWAETPATARGLLDEIRLVEDLNRLMAWPTVRAVRHDDSGVEILADLPEPERVGGLVRGSLMLARSLARTNG